jgi:endonuclease III
MMALRKMDLFSLDTLADGKEETLIKVQNVLLYSGYNWWPDGAADIMQFAWHVKNGWYGRMPGDPKVLLQFRGVGRKILMLLLQDAFVRHPDAGIVCDRHVAAVAVKQGYCTHKAAKGNEDKIAEELEQLVPKDQYRRLNEALAGPRQMWADSDNHQWMLEVAARLGCVNELNKVVAGVKVGARSSRQPRHQKGHQLLEEMEQRFRASKEARA